MNRETARKWEETRRLGRMSFVLKKGVLYWGLMMFGIFVGIQTSNNPDQFFSILAINLPVWFIAGVIFGFVLWHVSENKYAKYCADHKE